MKDITTTINHLKAELDDSGETDGDMCFSLTVLVDGKMMESTTYFNLSDDPRETLETITAAINALVAR